jgi:Plasmid recombination enzyme
MSTSHIANTPYAVLHVGRRKAKSMASISASSAHTMRDRPTPNADPDGPAPIVMFLTKGKTPYQAVSHLLENAERRNRDTVLCREIVLSASPSYFRQGRESIGGTYDADKVKLWATTSLAWARRLWPDQLASVVLHLDEQTPHLHLHVVPRMKTSSGVWKLNSKALFDRQRLRELQTTYGEAMAPLGIRRGEPNSQATHTEVRQFYGAVNASKNLPERPKPPPAPKAPTPPVGVLARALNVLGDVFGFETDHQKAMKLHATALSKWRESVKQIREEEAEAWDRMKACSAVAPIRCRGKSKEMDSTPNLGSSSVPSNGLMPRQRPRQ